jgi:hypothetical protein
MLSEMRTVQNRAVGLSQGKIKRKQVEIRYRYRNLSKVKRRLLSGKSEE